MKDRASFLDELKRLSPAQFEEVMFRLGIEPWIIPGPFAAQVLRATDLLRRLAQEEGWKNRLREVLADRTLETIGKQYEGYETEAEVRTIVSDYVKQPIAGRSQEQEQIDQFLKNNTNGTLLITAPAGFGKSSLLMHWQAQAAQQQAYFIAFHCFRTSPAVLRSIPNAYRHLLRQLYVYYNRREKQFPDENGMRDILFGMIRDCGAKKDKPLVIILDGLDEAEKTFDPLLSLPLPDHVYVIASARAEEEEKPAYLYNWVDIAQRRYLDRLPRHAISKWLERIEKLKPYAQDEDFSRQIYERTEGIPLFAKYLLDELVNTAELSGKDAIYRTHLRSL